MFSFPKRLSSLQLQLNNSTSAGSDPPFRFAELVGVRSSDIFPASVSGACAVRFGALTLEQQRQERAHLHTKMETRDISIAGLLACSVP